MGVRREGSGKSKAKQTDHQPQGHGEGAVAEDDVDDDVSSDSELQEIYVQAYACQFFRDDDAAQAVEDGAHLRQLAVPQEPEGQPLMLDRFDARWMLDVADLNKGSSTLNRASSLTAEEEEVDYLRYLGLPAGDHSVEVEGLGRFAPEGSYAHDGRRGLGDEKEANEPEDEVYGYYGRVASPPPPSVTRGSYAAVSNPDNTLHESSASSKTSGCGVGLAGVDVAGVGGQSGDGEGGEDDEVFVPEFGVPGGIAVPPTPRQHIMLVGTARTTMRSPQLEVLLRLKQASNAAFSFLSDGDPLHAYYVFLKSWGEEALAGEYTRQQELQTIRAEARQKENARKKLERERAASVQAASPAASGDDSKTASDAGSDDAPNLLGGAYDSSDDDDTEQAPALASSHAAARAKSAHAATEKSDGRKDGASLSPPVPGAGVETASKLGASLGMVEPDEAKRVVIEKMVGFVARNGQAFEDRVKEREKNNPTFDFLLTQNELHPFYKARLAAAKGAAPVTIKPNTNATATPQAKTATNGAAATTPNGNSHTASTAQVRSEALESGKTVRRNSTPVESSDARAAVLDAGDGGERAKGAAGPFSESAEGPSNGVVASNDRGSDCLVAALGVASNQTFSVGGQRSVEGSEQQVMQAVSGQVVAQNQNADGDDATDSTLCNGGTAGVNSSRGVRAEDSVILSAHSTTSEISTAQNSELAASGAHMLELRTRLALALANGSDSVGASGNERAADGTCGAGSHRSSATAISADLTDSTPAKAAKKASAAVAADGVGPEPAAADGGESEETRRANRLKRARLMKGHYKLAVMKSGGQSGGQDLAADGSQNLPSASSTADDIDGVSGPASPDEAAGSPGRSGGESSDGLSDLDSESEQRYVEHDVDDGDILTEINDEKGDAHFHKHGIEKERKTASSSGDKPSRHKREAGDTRRRKNSDSRTSRKRDRSRSRSPHRRHKDTSTRESKRDKTRHRRDRKSQSRSRSRERRFGDRESGSKAGDAASRSEGHTRRSSGSDRSKKGGHGKERDKTARSKEMGESSRVSRKESDKRESRDERSGRNDSQRDRGRRDGDSGRKERSRDDERRGESGGGSKRSGDRGIGNRIEDSRERVSGTSSKRSRRE